MSAGACPVERHGHVDSLDVPWRAGMAEERASRSQLSGVACPAACLRMAVTWVRVGGRAVTGAASAGVGKQANSTSTWSLDFAVEEGRWVCGYGCGWAELEVSGRRNSNKGKKEGRTDEGPAKG